MFSTIAIIQAPMAGAQSPELCIAVCEAGGLGSLPCAMLTPQLAREQIGLVRSRTRAPFNVNFFVHRPPSADAEVERRWRERLSPYYAEAGIEPACEAGPARAPFDDAMCAVVEETRPPIVSFHFGLPDVSLLARVKATGAKILSSATTVAEARWLAGRGVDAIIAQGREAGGHRGMFLDEDVDAQPGLFALLPQIVDAVGIPVIAAGAIADGRGIAAAFMLGAAAAQIGTAFLLTPQASISDLHRAALRAGRDDATRLTNLYTGRPARGILTRFIREQGPLNAEAPQFPLAAGASAPLRKAFEARGRTDFSPLWSGEAAALAREQDAGELTRRLWRETQELLNAASGRVGR
jgi:nitronate monooxygenase